MDGLESIASTPEGQELLGALAGASASMGIFALILGILSIVAMWKIFKKAGYAGWKSIIPIYNIYVLWKIAGRDFVRYILVIVAFLVVQFIIGFVGSSVSSLSGAMGVLLGIVQIAESIYIIIEICKVYHGLSTGFGHGTGFTLGLLFLNTIFILILGFGGDKYVGNGKGEDVPVE